MLTLGANGRGAGLAVEADLVGLLLSFSQIGLSFDQLSNKIIDRLLAA